MAKSKLESSDHLELERKSVLRVPDRGEYRRIFNEIVSGRKEYPDLSSIRRPGAVRSRELKDFRRRIYYIDENFLLDDEDWEIRLQVDSNILMIKQGNGANAGNPTMNRRERQYRLSRPAIGSLRDIEKYSGQKLPRALRELLGDKDEPIYPIVNTGSLREKANYYRRVEESNRIFVVKFEPALDEGEATPLFGEQYLIDQIELEAKRVIDVRSGIDLLDYPEEASFNLEFVRKRIIEPAINREDESLRRKFNLIPMYESKPKEGFRRVREEMQTARGMKIAEAARLAHLQAQPWADIAVALK